VSTEVEQPVETVRIVTSPLWNDYYVLATSLSTLLTELKVGPEATLLVSSGHGHEMLKEFATEFRWSKIAVTDDLSATQVGDLNVFFVYYDDVETKNMIESLPLDVDPIIFVVPSD
jgi:hypothetical protein